MTKVIHFLLFNLFLIVTLSQVTNITSEQSFYQTIRTHKYVIIKFYAPFCSQCKNIIPQYKKLSQLLVDNDVVVGQADATVLTNVSEKYEVRGFPMIKLFVDGVALDYNGQRTSEDMFEWIKKVAEARLTEISEEQINQLRQSKSFIVYSGSNQELLQTLQLLTITDPALHYYHMPHSNQQSLTLYIQNQTPLQYPPQQPLTLQNIKQWTLVSTLEIVIPLSTKEHLEYVFYDKKTPKDVLLVIREKDIGQSIWRKIEQICDANRNRLKCSFVDNTMEIYAGVKSYVRSRGQTVLTLTKDTLKQAYRFSLPLAELSEQSWSQFVQQVSQKKHKNIASAQNDQLEYQHVKTLMTQNYTSFINLNHAVLVQYVSPGCAKCSEFAEEFDLLAKEIYQSKEISVQVTVIDMRKNMEVAAQLKIMDFPTFRLYLSGAHLQYKGPNNRKQILEFIRLNLKIKPIKVQSITQVPTPSVILYDPQQTSSLTHLPAIFTRYPVYHLRQGNSIKIIVRHNDQEKTFPNNELSINVSSVSTWLYRQTDPILVNMLMTNVEGKLGQALKNQMPLLGLIDVETELSASLTKTMEEYCKKASDLVCGYAKKGEDRFQELMVWAGIEKDIATSEVIYINTVSFDKFIFKQKIQELSVEKLEQFVSDVRQGNYVKQQSAQPQAGKQTNTTQQQQRPKDLPSSEEL